MRYGFGLMHDVSPERQAQESLRRREAILRAVSFAAEELLKASSWEDAIQDVLEKLGQAAQVSRVYIFENRTAPDGTLLTGQRYEWVAAGITSQMDAAVCQELPWQAGGMGRWETGLSQGGIIAGLVREFPPCEQAVLLPQDIISIVAVPIFVERTWWGFIGFDDCVAERDWSIAEVAALKAAASTLGTAMGRQRVELALRQSEKLAATGRMAARIAHEINNPLAGIKNSFLLIKDAVGEDHPYHRYVGLIEREIERLTHIVRQMFGQYQADREMPRPLRVAAAIDDVVELLGAICRERGVLIETDAAAASEEIVLPEGLVKQILFNLLQNAIEASPPGASVRVTATVAKDGLTLTVTDQGDGIPEEVRSQVFEPFFTTKEGQKTSGLGLGLPTSRGIAEAMGGVLEFDSSAGEGTMFRLELPVAGKGD